MQYGVRTRPIRHNHDCAHLGGLTIKPWKTTMIDIMLYERAVPRIHNIHIISKAESKDFDST